MTNRWPFAPLPLFGFDLLTIDCPWTFSLYSEKGEGKSAQAHYECMPLDQIARLPVGQLVGADAWIFSWATAPLLPEAIDCLRAWGFVYVTRTLRSSRRGAIHRPATWRTRPVCPSPPAACAVAIPWWRGG